MLEEIKELAKKVNGITNEKLDKVNALLNGVIWILKKYKLDNLETRRKFDYNGYGLRRLAGEEESRIYFVKLSNGHIFPMWRSDIGRTGYYDGVGRRHMDYEEVVEAIKTIPDFLRNLKGILQRMKEKADKIPDLKIEIKEV